MYAKKYLFFTPAGVLVPKQPPTSDLIPKLLPEKTQAEVTKSLFLDPIWTPRTQPCREFASSLLPPNGGEWFFFYLDSFLFLFFFFFSLKQSEETSLLLTLCNVERFCPLTCFAFCLPFIWKTAFSILGQKIMSNCYIFQMLYLPSLGILFQSLTALC